jgi:hypothetical protein
MKNGNSLNGKGNAAAIAEAPTENKTSVEASANAKTPTEATEAAKMPPAKVPTVNDKRIFATRISQLCDLRDKLQDSLDDLQGVKTETKGADCTFSLVCGGRKFSTNNPDLVAIALNELIVFNSSQLAQTDAEILSLTL